jgi:hypothetical protein
MRMNAMRHKEHVRTNSKVRWNENIKSYPTWKFCQSSGALGMVEAYKPL